jgi:hypothetical protein
MPLQTNCQALLPVGKDKTNSLSASYYQSLNWIVRTDLRNWNSNNWIVLNKIITKRDGEHDFQLILKTVNRKPQILIKVRVMTI